MNELHRKKLAGLCASLSKTKEAIVELTQKSDELKAEIKEALRPEKPDDKGHRSLEVPGYFVQVQLRTSTKIAQESACELLRQNSLDDYITTRTIEEVSKEDLESLVLQDKLSAKQVSKVVTLTETQAVIVEPKEKNSKK